MMRRKFDVTTKKKAEPERGTTRPAVREDRVEKKTTLQKNQIKKQPLEKKQKKQ
jgi:hypothetical protein